MNDFHKGLNKGVEVDPFLLCYKTEDETLVDKDYKIIKYISSEVTEDGTKIEIWLCNQHIDVIQ